MNKSDSTKYWATNRGWISTKFCVKNPVTHFLNLHKKKTPHQSNHENPHEHSLYFLLANKPTNTSTLPQRSPKKPNLPTSPINQKIKPQTTPHNYNILSSFVLDKSNSNHGGQLDRDNKDNNNNFSNNKLRLIENTSQTRTTHQPRRNLSLHVKREKLTIENDLREMKGLGAVTAKGRAKQPNTTHQQPIDKTHPPNLPSSSQRNFKTTNYGRYKPQMMFLQPHIMRASSASMGQGHKRKSKHAVLHYSHDNNPATTQMYETLEYKKSTIYEQIMGAMKVDQGVEAYGRFVKAGQSHNKTNNHNMSNINHHNNTINNKPQSSFNRTTSMSNPMLPRQPIEYMTEYGQANEQDQGHSPGLNQKQLQMYMNNNYTCGNKASKKRRRPNLSVLRHKLNLHFNNNMSGYKERLLGGVGVGMGVEGEGRDEGQGEGCEGKQGDGGNDRVL